MVAKEDFRTPGFLALCHGGEGSNDTLMALLCGKETSTEAEAAVH